MTYRDAYGLFWNDRYKALAEAILNIVISIYLGFKLGLVGIFGNNYQYNNNKFMD